MKKLVLLLLFINHCSSLFADTFTVTTNADSGPGSLREATTPMELSLVKLTPIPKFSYTPLYAPLNV